MYSSFQLALKYVNYHLAAANGKGHGIHSPFVFDFITNVLNDRTEYLDYDKIESVRRKSLRDQTILKIEDHGAGSSSSTSKERSVSSIARHAVKSKKYAQLLYRIVKYYRPASIIELGTSLGITTGYLASGNLKGNVYTFEGAKQVSQLASQNFEKLGLSNIQIIDGNFDDTLLLNLEKIQHVDLAFIDGNHRKKPTIQYFEQLLEKASEHSIFIFDDIHWSKEMEEAWEHIKQHNEVTLSIDLFFIGLVFFRKEQKVPQHFCIRF